MNNFDKAGAQWGREERNLRRIILFLAVLACSPSAIAANPFSCIATAVPPIVRGEGVTELVGDVLLECSGGIPTLAGAPVPRVNLQVFLNTHITSRLVSTPFSEALLLIDDPAPANQRVCAPGPCVTTGVGTPGGVVYNATAPPVANVYQGQQAGPNSITFLGLPIDAPGDTARRVLRITNIRANAGLLGTSSTFNPAQIVMNISFGPGAAIPVSNPQLIVAYTHKGLDVSRIEVRRNGVLRDVARDEVISLGPCTDNQEYIVVRFTEGFASSFKPVGRIPSTVTYDPTMPLPVPLDPQAQPGVNYHTESGFYNPAFPSTQGLNIAGLADRGTRLSLRFTLPTGMIVSADSPERNVSPSRATLIDIVTEGNITTITWEIIRSDPFAIESLDFTVGVAGSSSVVNQTAQMAWGFSPVSSDPSASATAPIPRFLPPIGPVNAFVWNPCYSTLLFPFVSSQGGNETAVVISNTSADPFGTGTASGPCNIHYYGTSASGGAAPAMQTTSVIDAGKTFRFTLGSGGMGLAATPDFQGYVIVTCRFPYVHGLAALGNATTQKISYLGIVLDRATLNRTTMTGEQGGH